MLYTFLLCFLVVVYPEVSTARRYQAFHMSLPFRAERHRTCCTTERARVLNSVGASYKEREELGVRCPACEWLGVQPPKTLEAPGVGVGLRRAVELVLRVLFKLPVDVNRAVE
jgi:hypothetical protein